MEDIAGILSKSSPRIPRSAGYYPTDTGYIQPIMESPSALTVHTCQTQLTRSSQFWIDIDQPSEPNFSHFFILSRQIDKSNVIKEELTRQIGEPDVMKTDVTLELIQKVIHGAIILDDVPEDTESSAFQ